MRPNGSQDQCVDIPFTGGMAEGAAPFVFNGPFVESAEDCVITKEGAYKRYGGGLSVPEPASTVGGSRGISVFDSTLIQHTVEGPQQFNETQNDWRASNVKGFVPTQPRTDLVISQSDRMVYNTQIAVSSNGYELYCWDEMTPGSRDNSSYYAGGWTGKGLAIRDPDGGWTIAPTSVINFGENPGHQIIAVGATFLIGFTTLSGFQVYKVADNASSFSSAVQIVTNATGSSYTTGFTQYGAVHDCCLSTSGAYAYFLVIGSSTNYRVYTVDATGQIGTASTGAATPVSAWALCVDAAKVYVAESGRFGDDDGVRLSKIAEASISAGTAATSIGSFQVAGSRAFRVRMVGDIGKGVLVAVEAQTTAVATDLPLDTFIPAFPAVGYPSYLSLPTGRYVEVGFLPTSDVIGDYTSVAYRAYAHGYVLGTGWSTNTDRKPQILLTFDDRNTVGASTVNGDGMSGFSAYDYGHWYSSDTSGPFRGSVWVDCVDYVTQDQEDDVTAFKFRSLTRVAWDSAMSDWDVETIDGDVNWVKINRSSLSRVVNGSFALTCQVDSITTGGRRCHIDVDPKPPLSVLSHGNLFFDGSCQDVWDGQHSFENTPHFPPIVGWVPANTPVGDPTLMVGPTPSSISECVPGYTDIYSFYWEWADANGYLHRSAVRQISLEMTGPMITGGATHYTQSGNGPGYFAVMPPLSANDTTTYRNMRLVTAQLPGDGLHSRSMLVTKYTIDWTQTAGGFTPLLNSYWIRLAPGTPSGLVGYLYTDGGVLEAEAPPAPISITSTRDRLWLISADNRRQVYFTKPLEALVAPEFNANLTVDIPADAGEGVVLLTVDDKPVILCEKGLYFISGDGPNALGTQGSFVPTVIQSDTGCKEKNSVARCDYGGFFQGERGIYLLDRGLNVQLVSQGVQDQATGDISKAVAVPREQQVRFGLSEGGILVYHYALKAWTKLNLTAIDAVIWDDEYTRLWDVTNYGVVRTQVTDDGQDAENIITMKIVTAWIKADKMQGFARFKKALLLMSQQGGTYDFGPITVDTYFNYEYIPDEFSGYSETVTFANANRKPAEYRAQNQLTIGRQKSEAVKFVITSPNFDAETPYAPLSLEGLALVVGTITSTQFRHLKQQLKN